MASGAALKISRWLDHLPPWLAWGAIVFTEAYSPLELAGMALPLGLAALVEWRRWDLARWRRPLEVAALLALAIQVWARIGIVPTTVNTLFLLCGIRLTLPRELPQRRQILLMGFLLFLTTSVATTEIPFALWSLAFMVGGGIVLMQQAWEPSASLRPGPLRPPPYRKVFHWSAAVTLLAALTFVAMPRLTLALHPFPWGIPGLSSAHAGLSDRLNLGDKGPLLPNSDVALRIVPRKKPGDGSPPNSSALELLKGITLEEVDGQRWSPMAETPPRRFLDLENGGQRSGERLYDFYVAPNPRGIIPLPAGSLRLVPTPGAALRSGLGGSVRWAYPSARTLLLSVAWSPQARQGMPLSDRRRSLLTRTGQGTEAALRWSRRVVPEDVPSQELASRLSLALQA